MKAIITAAMLASCAAPAIADDCMPMGDTLMKLANNGFRPTFIDADNERTFLMVEDGKGRWVIVAVIDDMICPLLAGANGKHIGRKPNA